MSNRLEKIIFASLRSQLDLLRRRDVTSVELITAHLEQIQRINPVLNAVVQLRADAALAEAHAADKALDAGEPTGVLCGVPFSVKDSLETAGMITTSGTEGRAHFIPNQDATIVARVKQAGGILLAKTNCPELVLPFETDNLVYGRTNNPWDVTRTPGGSTGGEGALIAAGGSSLGLTVDAAASIRLPAHFCGIAGIKPTTGRVPRTGHFPRIGGATAALSAAGPMARTIDDLALVLPILCGEDGYDAGCVPVSLKHSDDVDVSRLRVAFHTDNGVRAADAESAAAVQQAADVLAQQGAIVEEACPPGMDSVVDLLWGLFSGDSGVRVQVLLQRIGTQRISPMLQELLDRQSRYALSTAEFMGVLGRVDGWRSTMQQFFRRYDVLLCPVCAHPAPLHGTLLGEEAAYSLSYTIAYNLAGVPAASVPVALTTTGLPIGVQVVAGHWREDIVLAAARVIEQAAGGYRVPPAFA
jgi:amidase